MSDEPVLYPATPLPKRAYRDLWNSLPRYLVFVIISLTFFYVLNRSRPRIDEVKATTQLQGTQLAITNLNTVDWVDVQIDLLADDHTASKQLWIFTCRIPRLSAGNTRIIPVSQFVNVKRMPGVESPSHFDPALYTPRHVVLIGKAKNHRGQRFYQSIDIQTTSQKR